MSQGYIAEHSKPYGNTVTPEEDAILDTLSLDMQWPGFEKPGLLPQQRQIAVALTRLVDRYGVAYVMYEMAPGKTRAMLAATELMDAYPALVTCPPHLYPKWIREAEASVPGLRAVHVKTIEELERVKAEYEPGEKLLVVIKRSQFGSGRYCRCPLVNYIHKKMGGFFQVLLADEVRKGTDDQGQAFSLLTEAVPAVIMARYYGIAPAAQELFQEYIKDSNLFAN